jgi:hypothetical protein
MNKLVEIVLSEKAKKIYLFFIACYFLGHMIGSLIGYMIY